MGIDRAIFLSAVACWAMLGALFAGCGRGSPAPARDLDGAAASSPSAAVTEDPAVPPASGSGPVDIRPPPAASSAEAASTPCPDGMVPVEGGIFWMGSTGIIAEESPRHRVAIRSFCMATHELTVGAYEACVTAEKCTPARPETAWCNSGKTGRSEHPINCVDWRQARAACEFRGGRLPTEREWEYAARGGAEQRAFSWGPEPPDGRACYSHEGTCAVGSFPAGAFGLFDISGNVWEWTDTWFARYPDEPAEGLYRVYRGGSFSRRFPKWLRNGLRNRYRPEEWGAHLGLRCAADRSKSPCPAGSHERERGCELDDAPGAPAASDSATRPAAPAGSAAPAASSSAPIEKKKEPPLTMARDPQFDEDCAKWKPGRGLAYAVRGGSFADRQKKRGELSCVNRDVGVGWNSVCCPR
jgi:formylglycine-generating enzyme required for sulfatase activity